MGTQLYVQCHNAQTTNTPTHLGSVASKQTFTPPRIAPGRPVFEIKTTQLYVQCHHAQATNTPTHLGSVASSKQPPTPRRESPRSPSSVFESLKTGTSFRLPHDFNLNIPRVEDQMPLPPCPCESLIAKPRRRKTRRRKGCDRGREAGNRPALQTHPTPPLWAGTRCACERAASTGCSGRCTRGCHVSGGQRGVHARRGWE